MSMQRIYYVYYGFFSGQDEIDFDELDARIVEAQENLEADFTGSARDFNLELVSFEPEGNNELEMDVSYVIWLMEDDEDEIELINKAILEKLEEISIEVEDVRLIEDIRPE